MKSVLTYKPVNTVVRKTVYPLRSLLPLDFVKKIPVVGILSFDLPGLDPFFINVDDHLSSVLKLTYWTGIPSHELETWQVLRRILPNCEVIIDVGANFGWYTILFGSAPVV